MGWRDREWAKFSDDEWNALYGVQRKERAPSAGLSAPPVEGTRRHRTRDRLRIGTRCAVVVATAGVAILAYSGRAATTGSSAGDAPVLYGLAGAANDLMPGGSRMVCTEEAVNPATGAWNCLLWMADVHNVPVLSPHPYDGPCGHVVADQSRGAWACLDAHTPRAGPVPPAPS